MKIYYDKYKQPTPPKIYLGTSNNKILCAINGIDESSFSLTMNLVDTWSVTFDLNRYLLITDADNRTREIESNVYLLINHLMRLYIENIGWFIIEPPTINHDGYKETQTITAQSCEIEMQQHDLKTFKINQGTTDSYEMLATGNVEVIDDVEFAKEQIKFYNPDNEELSLLDLAIKASGLNGWSVGEIDSNPKEYQYYDDGELKTKSVKLADEIGAFDLDSQNLYSFFTQDVAKYFECIFVFDFKNMKINAYHPENLGKDTNINIGFRNIQKENTVTVDDSNIFTRYYVQGSDDLGITYVNFGSNYIEDISYFLNEKYLSKELIEKYKLWLSDYESYRTQYVENTTLYNQQMNTISELYNRVPLDDCSTDWSTFEDDKLLEAQANYQAQLKGYEQYYVDKDGNFDEEALKNSPDANDYYQIKDVILPSIQIEIDNRKLQTDDGKKDYIDSYKTDWKLYGLDELQVNLDTYQNTIDICEKNGYDVPYSDESGHTKDTHDTMYAKYLDAKNQLDATYEGSCKWYYNKVQSEIDDATTFLNSYDTIRKNVAKSASKESWSTTVDGTEYSFTSDDLSDLSKVYIDGDYTNENMFLVDSDDQVTAIDEQLKLLSAAQDDLYSTAHPQYTYTTQLDNFLALYDYKNYTDNLNVGDYIHLGQRDNYVVKLRVVSIACNLLEMNNDLTIEFSNMIQSRYKRSDDIYLLDMASGGSKSSASGSSNNFLSNEGVTLTSGLIQKLLATGAFSNKVSQIVNNEFAGVIAGGSSGITIDELNAKMLKVTDLVGENGFFSYLQTKLLSTGMLKADSAEFTDLSALVANIKNAVIGTSYTETGIMINLTTENATMSEAFIKNLIAQYITVNELKASDIITDKIKILSEDGKLKIDGNTFTIYDENDNPVIQLGQDKNGNYGLVISDENGAILLDSEGLHEGIVPDQFIKNTMIEDGTIGKEKVNFDFLEPNEYGGLDAAKVTINGKGIDSEFTSIENTIEQLDRKLDESAPYFISLQNESQNIPCTSSGITSINMLIEIPFDGYIGSTKADCSVAVGTLPLGITLGEKTSATTTESGRVVLNIASNSNLGGDNVLNGSILLTFTIGSKSIAKSFTWTKSKAGEQGSAGKNARLYALETSDNVLKKSMDNALSPTSITLSAYYHDGDTAKRNAYNGRFIISESTDNVTYTNKYVSTSDENTITYSPTTTDVATIRAELYASGDTVNKLDSQTIIVLTDSNDIASELTEVKQTVSGVKSQVDGVEKSITDKVWQTDITNTINNYDQTTVKTIKDTVAENTTKIGEITSSVSSLTTTVEGKADGSTVTKLENEVSTVKQTQEGFTQTVEKMQTQLDGNDKAIEETKSSIEQTASEIRQEVSKTLDDYSTTEQVNGLIDNKGDEILLSVSQTYAKTSQVQYYVSDSSTELTGGTWSSETPVWEVGKYVWQKTVTTRGDGVTTESNPVCIQGAKGENGTKGDTGEQGTSVDSITPEYYVSTSSSALSGGLWSTEQPTWEENKYIWTRSKIVYKNPTKTEYTTAICDTASQVGASLKTTINEIEQRVVDAEGNIATVTTTANEAKTEVSNVKGDLAQLSTTVEGVSATATDNKTAIANLTVTTDGIVQEITDATGGVNADGTRKSTLSVTLDGIKAEAEEATSSIEKLEIGGANLVLGTLTASTNGWVSYGKTDSDKGGFSTYNNNVYSIKYVNSPRYAVYNLTGCVGKEITVSCDFTNLHVVEGENVNTSAITMSLCQTETDDDGGQISYTGKELLSDPVIVPNATDELGETVHFSQTLTLEEDYIGFCLSTEQLDASSTVYVLISNLKIELGNKETAWTPATQDLTDAINDVQNDVNITAEQKQEAIDSLTNELKILSGDYDTYKKNTTLSSLIESNPNGFSTSVKKVVESQFDETNSKIAVVESAITQNEEYWKATFKRIGAENVIVSGEDQIPESETVNITLSPEGVRVEGDDGQFTVMDKSGLSGYYQSLDNCVFKIREDITITKRLQVENGIDFLTLKQIPLTYHYNDEEILAVVDVISGGTS